MAYIKNDWQQGEGKSAILALFDALMIGFK